MNTDIMPIQGRSSAFGLVLEALSAHEYDEITVSGLPPAIYVPARDAILAVTTASFPPFDPDLARIATERRIDVLLLRVGDCSNGWVDVDFALGSLPCAVWVERGFALYQDADGTWLVPDGFGPAVSITWEGCNLEIVPPYADLIERAAGVARAARTIARLLQCEEA